MFIRSRSPRLTQNRCYVLPYSVSRFLVSNNFVLLELADILLSHNYNKHNSRLAMVLIVSCNFHIRKSKHKRLSALFRFSYVRNLDK